MGSTPIPASASRHVAEVFYDAYARVDVDRLAALIHDDVQWTINGPVELLNYCGTRHGKRAVLDLIACKVPEVFKVTGFVPETFLIDGERAATLNRLTATRSEDGRVISYRVAQFVRFKDDKVIEYCSIIDSFDAAEQVLGRRIEFEGGRASGPANDLVTV